MSTMPTSSWRIFVLLLAVGCTTLPAVPRSTGGSPGGVGQGGAAGRAATTGTGGGVGTGGVVAGSGGMGVGGAPVNPSGGSAGPGGHLGAGGAIGTGGVTNLGSGGAAGGKVGTGGMVATGGVVATGGAVATGGVGATGTGGAGGVVPTGGRQGSGGVGTGGMTALCQEAATQCASGGLQTCTSGQWGMAKACGTHQTCTGAAGTAKCTCNVDPVCTAAGMTCATSTSLATCATDSDGCLAATSSPCSAGLVCERLAPASCADPASVEWPVPDVHPTNYRDNGDGTVTDNVTGLMWQKAADSTTYGQVQAVAYCNGLTLAGHDDWRLPTQIELLSILDYSVTTPSFNAVFSGPAYYYWSSTLVAGAPTRAWSVYFDTGSADGFGSTTDLNNARCVR